ncbi:MAG: hypothetical protein JXQ29_18865, partial [Planctomycetes bacterium]|nr:hypothetical protein [Planctomycetota bacterium]
MSEAAGAPPRRGAEPGVPELFPFEPRVIHPVKITDVVVFSAEEAIRSTVDALGAALPWARVQLFFDPVSVAEFTAAGASVLVVDDTALNLVDPAPLRRRNPKTVILLLSGNESVGCAPPSVARQRFPYTARADLILAVDRADLSPAKVAVAGVRLAQDRLNIQAGGSLRRFIFLLVDDEPRWFSQFLPILYGIIGQRADVMITRTYEETLEFLFGVPEAAQIDAGTFRTRGRGEDVVCLITDVVFPRGEQLTSDAGRDLVQLVRTYYPRYPVIVASKAKEAQALQDVAFLLPKGDPGSLERLRDQIRDFTGIGDFLVCDATGRERHRVKNIFDMHRLVREAEEDTAEAAGLRDLLASYGQKDMFSTWLYMHSYCELAGRLRPRRGTGRDLVGVLRRELELEMDRMKRTPLVVGGTRIFDLRDLEAFLRSADPTTVQPLSDDDVFSSWLDFQG